MSSIGLVLGAGGTAGYAYHVATLAALAEATGWDPRDADLILGTSAGANVAASLRAGISIEDHHARSLGQALSDEAIAIGPYRGLDELAIGPNPALRLVDLLRPAAPWLAIPAFFPPIPWHLGLLFGLLPAGRVPTAPLGARVRDIFPDPWPTQPTWVCAARARDGRRVVFGRDDIDGVDLATAVEASSAVPGYLAPVRAGRHRYLDGAIISPTNADLVAPLGFDLVVVISPMSAADEDGWFGRGLCSRMLAREVDAIGSRGVPVLVVEPTADDIAAMGDDLMASERARSITEVAFVSARARFADRSVADQLRVLTEATTARSSAPIADR